MTRSSLPGGSSAVGFSAVSQGVPVWKKALFVDSHFSLKVHVQRKRSRTTRFANRKTAIVGRRPVNSDFRFWACLPGFMVLGHGVWEADQRANIADSRAGVVSCC